MSAMPNQALERTGLSLWVWPWDFWFAHVSSPVAQLGRSAARHTMKSEFTFARVAYGSVAIFFWMAGAGQVIIALTPRGQNGSLLTALIFAMIGTIPFLRYRYWSRRAA